MKEFDEYTNKFDMNNKITKLKYNHSYRVSKISNTLASNLTTDKSDIELATFIGLFHDIGRFEQVKKFNTLSDINTMDHGDFGAFLLFEQDLIKQFRKNRDEDTIIKLAVLKHNKYSINEDEYNTLELFHINLIRDADKIDIFNIWANLDEIEITSDGEISKEVSDEFYENKMIHNENKKTNADKLIGTLSYIFDINYPISFKYIDDNKFLDNLYNRLDNKEQFKEFFDYANKYIKDKKRGDKNVRKKIRSLKCREK